MSRVTSALSDWSQCVTQDVKCLCFWMSCVISALADWPQCVTQGLYNDLRAHRTPARCQTWNVLYIEYLVLDWQYTRTQKVHQGSCRHLTRYMTIIRHPTTIQAKGEVKWSEENSDLVSTNSRTAWWYLLHMHLPVDIYLYIYLFTCSSRVVLVMAVLAAICIYLLAWS